MSNPSLYGLDRAAVVLAAYPQGYHHYHCWPLIRFLGDTFLIFQSNFVFFALGLVAFVTGHLIYVPSLST